MSFAIVATVVLVALLLFAILWAVHHVAQAASAPPIIVAVVDAVCVLLFVLWALTRAWPAVLR